MRIPILMYHDISSSKNDLSISIKNFYTQMKLMKLMGYEAISLTDLKKLKIKKKSFVITFDDGYENVFLNALPILKKFNFKAICFFVTNMIGKYNLWDRKKKNFYKLKLMNFSQIQSWINQGMLVGSHTHNHLNLTNINFNLKLNEIYKPISFFQKNFFLNINSFSYPFGNYDNYSLKLVKKNYAVAVSTKRSRFIKNRFNYHELPRIPINKNDSIFKFFFKIKTCYEDIKFKN